MRVVSMVCLLVQSMLWFSGVYKLSLDIGITTGIRGFAECRTLCRVHIVGHSTKDALPRAALGKVLLSVTSSFTECKTLGTEIHSAEISLPSVKHSAKAALGKGPSAVVYSWRPLTFAEHRALALGKDTSLPSVKRLTLGRACFAKCHFWTLGKVHFYFLNFVHQIFCGMFLHYVDLHVLFVNNYNRGFNR